MLYYYISIFYFLFSETYWYFPHLCRFFYLFLAHLTDCIIGQLHTFVILAMYNSRHVFAVACNSFLFIAGFLGYPQPGGGTHPPIPREGVLGKVLGDWANQALRQAHKNTRSRVVRAAGA